MHAGGRSPTWWIAAASVLAIAGCTVLLDTGSITERGASDDGGQDSTAGDGSGADAGSRDGGPQDAAGSDGAPADAAPCQGPVCATGATRCTSATSIETCGTSASCTGVTWSAPTTCPQDAGVTGYVCERSGNASCVDPNWAEWPMPNGAVDVPGASNLESYTDNKDGTVTDHVTGLMWQQAVSTSIYTWGSASTAGTAQSYCAALSTAGYDDWRLPSLVELMSIVDPSVGSPAISSTYFPGTPSAVFRSATPVVGSPGNAWVVTFGTGDTGSDAVAAGNYARCVR